MELMLSAISKLQKNAVLYQLSYGEPRHWEQVSLLSSSLTLKGMKQ